jgi:hypothetical protein
MTVVRLRNARRRCAFIPQPVRVGYVMGSSREYWQYARECARWAAEAKKRDEQDLYLEMAKAWTHIALVDADVIRQARQAAS